MYENLFRYRKKKCNKCPNEHATVCICCVNKFNIIQQEIIKTCIQKGVNLNIFVESKQFSFVWWKIYEKSGDIILYIYKNENQSDKKRKKYVYTFSFYDHNLRKKDINFFVNDIETTLNNFLNNYKNNKMENHQYCYCCYHKKLITNHAN